MTFANDMLTVLSTAATLEAQMTGVVDGGYFDTWLIRVGKNATPTAFREDGVPKVCVVITDPDVQPDLQKDDGVPDAANRLMVVWMYGPDDDDGRARLETLRKFIYSTLADEDFPLSDGSHAFPLWIGDRGTDRNNEEFQGSIVGNVQFRVVYQRARM